jgi:outer membrane protein TolC
MALFELERGRAEGAILEAEKEVLEAEGALAASLGVHHAHLKEGPGQVLPARPSSLPQIESLKRRMVQEHPELGRCRARYEVAERALRLEIAKQFPDFQFGPSYDRETGEKKGVLGLTLGIELPLFDRNQQGIAQARGGREEARRRYEAAMYRALAGLEQAFRSLEGAIASRALQEDKILPLAKNNLALAKKAIESGTGDALRLLDAERSEREIRLEVLAADLAERRAWMGLEQAAGFPLLAFPPENRTGIAPPPALLEAPSPHPCQEGRKNPAEQAEK